MSEILTPTEFKQEIRLLVRNGGDADRTLAAYVACHARVAELEAALKPFAAFAMVLPENRLDTDLFYARHTEAGSAQLSHGDFRIARAALAAPAPAPGEVKPPSVRERLGKDKTAPGHPGDPELLR